MVAPPQLMRPYSGARTPDAPFCGPNGTTYTVNGNVFPRYPCQCVRVRQSLRASGRQSLRACECVSVCVFACVRCVASRICACFFEGEHLLLCVAWRGAVVWCDCLNATRDGGGRGVRARARRDTCVRACLSSATLPRYIDAYDSVYPSMENGAIFLATRITSTPQSVTPSCAGFGSESCKYANGPATTTYVGDPDMFTLMIDHTMNVPTRESRAAVHALRCVALPAHCIAWRARGHTAFPHVSVFVVL